MLITAYFIILCLNFVQLYKKNFNTFITYISIFLIFILLAGNTSSPDVQNYANMYSLSPNTSLGVEFGYGLIQRVGNFLGLTYFQFRVCIVILPIFLIINTVRVIANKNLHLFLFLYLLYLVFMDSVQLRNFIAFSFVFFGLRFLLNNSKFGVLKFLFFVFIAASFHITSLFFILFIIVKLRKAKTMIVFLVGFIAVLCLVYFIDSDNFLLSEILRSASIDNRFQNYLQRGTKFGFLTSFSMQLLNVIFSFLLLSCFSLKERKVKEYKYCQMIMWFNVIMIFSFPMQMLNITFYRLFRNVTIVNIMSAQIVLNYTNELKRRNLIIFLSIIYILIWFWYDFFFLDELFQKVWVTILSYNFFLLN